MTTESTTARVYRFHDLIALTVGDSQTLYVNPAVARWLAGNLTRLADDVGRCRFHKSTAPEARVDGIDYNGDDDNADQLVQAWYQGLAVTLSRNTVDGNLTVSIDTSQTKREDNFPSDEGIPILDVGVNDDYVGTTPDGSIAPENESLSYAALAGYLEKLAEGHGKRWKEVLSLINAHAEKHDRTETPDHAHNLLQAIRTIARR